MSKTKVSVIIPVYNSAPFLEQCITALINQNEKRLEFIFVDDASTDHSVEIIKQYQLQDDRIRLITQPHSNAGVARNTGLAHARGEYIHFHDSDDFVEPDIYSEWFDFARMTQADVCKCFFYRWNMQSGVTEERTFGET